jgi:hypothetical protein
MAETRYYTPSMEEFHVGFECERANALGGWDKYVVTLSSWSSNQMWLAVRDDPTNFRVKYLDKEDIESLGWKDSKDRDMSENYGYQFTKPIRYLSGGDAYYRLRYWYNNNRLRIEPLGAPIFDGTIKNKSELKILLKQLGIDGR